MSILARAWSDKYGELFDVKYVKAMEKLSLFQVVKQDIEYLEAALVNIDVDWHVVARVFEYGKKKYKAWNWARGMDWSVCMACIARHFEAIAKGEVVDPESGQPHIGHVVCNIVMLQHYCIYYRDGNDLFEMPTTNEPVLSAKRLARSISDLPENQVP